MVLSDYDKGRIEGRMRSMSHAEISLETGIHRCTVSNFISRLKTRHTPNNLPLPGQLRIMTAAQTKRIIAAAEANIRVPFVQLPNVVNISVSESTIR